MDDVCATCSHPLGWQQGGTADSDINVFSCCECKRTYWSRDGVPEWARKQARRMLAMRTKH